VAKGKHSRRQNRDKGAKQPAPVAPASSRPTPTSKKRLYSLLALLVCVLGLAIGNWVYDGWINPLPDVPAPALAGTDPEIADEITKARENVAKDPRSVTAWAQLGYLFDVYLFADEAIACYRAAEILEPSNWAWPYLRASLLIKSAYPEEALPCLERAADLAPHPGARAKLADFLMTLGHMDRAEQHYRRVLATDAKNSQALFGLAQVASAQGDFPKALQHLEKVGDDPHARKRVCALRAATYERLGKHQEAAKERTLFAALPADEPRLDVHWQLQELRKGVRGRILRASSLGSQGKAAEAETLLLDTVARYPQSAQAWVALAVFKEGARDYVAAEQAFQKCLALAPHRADFHCSWGDFLQARNRHREAAAAFRKAIDLAPADAKAHSGLGDSLRSAGDLPGAAQAFRDALRLNPELADARAKLSQFEKR
jgi:tetratricopeptide (TPR) repeat protein